MSHVLWVVGALLLGAPQQEPPTLILSPATAIPGEQVGAFGSGFCPTPACPPVEIRVGDALVLESVDVSQDGSFAVAFVTPGAHGQLLVVASQDVAGEPTRAEAPLVVAAGDRPPSSDSPTSDPPVAETVSTTASVAATTDPVPPGPSTTAGRDAEPAAADVAEDGNTDPVLPALIVAVVGSIAAAGLWRRRRQARRGGL